MRPAPDRDRNGLNDLEAIATVKGVDGIFVGPGDLSASLGYLGRQGAPVFQTIVVNAIGRIVAAGKAAGILTSDTRFAHRFLEAVRRCRLDSGLLARESERLAREFSVRRDR